MESSRWAGLGSDRPPRQKPWAAGLAVVQGGLGRRPASPLSFPSAPTAPLPTDSHSRVPSSRYPCLRGSRALARTSWEGGGGPDGACLADCRSSPSSREPCAGRSVTSLSSCSMNPGTSQRGVGGGNRVRGQPSPAAPPARGTRGLPLPLGRPPVRARLSPLKGRYGNQARPGVWPCRFPTRDRQHGAEGEGDPPLQVRGALLTGHTALQCPGRSA